MTDEAKHSNGDVAISMDSVSTDSRYSQQLQLIEEQVTLKKELLEKPIMTEVLLLFLFPGFLY